MFQLFSFPLLPLSFSPLHLILTGELHLLSEQSIRVFTDREFSISLFNSLSPVWLVVGFVMCLSLTLSLVYLVTREKGEERFSLS